jgi:tRNA-splicing ligase RtcB
VPIEDAARQQIENVARLPCIHKHVAVMPDVHLGMGATVGSVIPTVSAIIRGAVGVDIGCSMAAVGTNITAPESPDSLGALRAAIEAAVPHGRTDHGRRNDAGAWTGEPPAGVVAAWDQLKDDYAQILDQHPNASLPRPSVISLRSGPATTLSSCASTKRIGSGSCCIRARAAPAIGSGPYFIELAKKEMRRSFINLPDKDLAYLPEGTEHFDAYVRAVGWTQRYARFNRELMVGVILDVLRRSFPHLETAETAVTCHHNYVIKERHFGAGMAHPQGCSPCGRRRARYHSRLDRGEVVHCAW